MEFKTYRLGDIAKVQISGVDKKTNERETYVRLCNFTDVYKNWAITKDMYPKFMEASANDKEIDSFTIHKGQVALTKDSETRDDIGISTYIADDFDELVVLGYHTALITPDESIINGKYLNALLHSRYFHDYWYNNASGSGMRYTLSELALRNAVVHLPSLEEQVRIGSLFSSIDRKISLNRRINTTLEAMSKQLYDYWFVQFDFPNEEGKPYKSSGGKMVWNEKLKREIPEGWEDGCLGDLFISQPGYAFKSTEWCDSGIPVLTIKNIQEDGSVDFSNTSFISKDSYSNKFEKFEVENGNMIFAMSGNTIGKAGIIASSNDIVLINQRVLIIKSVPDDLGFSYFSINNEKIRNKIIQLGANSAQPNISEASFRSITVLIPSEKIKNKFNKNVEAFFNRIINNRVEISTLTSLRDFLLPLLMNGQVTINDK